MRRAMRHRPSTRAGFTLIEVILVLLILALALALVPPLFQGALGTVSLKRDARELGNALRHLRSVAISTQAPQALTVDVEARTYSVGDRDVVQLPDSIHLEIVTAQSEMTSETVGSFRFFPDGGATGGQIILSRSGHRLVLDIDWVTGRVRLYEDAEDA